MHNGQIESEAKYFHPPKEARGRVIVNHNSNLSFCFWARILWVALLYGLGEVKLHTSITPLVFTPWLVDISTRLNATCFCLLTRYWSSWSILFHVCFAEQSSETFMSWRKVFFVRSNRYFHPGCNRPSCSNTPLSHFQVSSRSAQLQLVWDEVESVWLNPFNEAKWLGWWVKRLKPEPSPESLR